MRRKSFEVGLEGRKGSTWFRHCSHFCQVCRIGFSKTANHKSRNGTPKMEESRTPGVEVVLVVEDRSGWRRWWRIDVVALLGVWGFDLGKFFGEMVI